MPVPPAFATVTQRADKGAPLTIPELDQNFTGLAQGLNNLDARVKLQGAEQVRLLDFVNLLEPDHTAGFQNAIDYANKFNYATITWPSCGLRLNGTVRVWPTLGNSECHINLLGHGNIAVGGASNRSVFDIIGLRDSTWQGFGLGYANGLQNIFGFDLDTRSIMDGYPAADSCSKNEFVKVGALLGDGVNNTLFRLGHKSGGQGDVSNILFRTCTAYGKNNGSPGAADGASLNVAGQSGIRIEGRNTLSNAVNNCLLAYCDKAITTVTEAVGLSAAEYGSEVRDGRAVNGGGGLNIDNVTVFSHNKQDILYASVQTLKIGGASRSEDSLHFLKVTDSSDCGDISMDGVQIDDCRASAPEGFVDGSVFFLGRPSRLIMRAVDIGPSLAGGGTLQTDHCIIANSGSGYAPVVDMTGGAVAAAGNFIRGQNNNLYKFYRKGVAMRNAQGVFTGNYFPDIY